MPPQMHLLVGSAGNVIRKRSIYTSAALTLIKKMFQWPSPEDMVDLWSEEGKE